MSGSLPITPGRFWPKSGRLAKVLIHALAMLGLLATEMGVQPRSAVAQEVGPLENAPAIMRETLWREGRVSITPKFGFTVGDPYEVNLLPGFDVTYFFTDWFGLGIDFAYGIPMATDLKDNVGRELRRKRDAVCPSSALQGPAYEQCLAQLGVNSQVGTSSIQALATLQVAFAPIRGKMMWFDSVLVHYDTLITLGGVYGRIRGTNGIDDDNAFGPSVGIAGRLFFNGWLGLQLEVRDFLLQYHEATDQRGNKFAKEFHNHVMFTFGLSMSFPQSPRFQTLE